MSKRQAHRFMKPWITKRLRKSIKIKNALFYSGDIDKYKYYRNKLLTLSRTSKKLYYSAYFSDNMTNMRQTWAGINSLINCDGRCSNSITSLKYPNGELTHNPFEIPNILNNYFTSVGPNLASKISQSNRHFSEYLRCLNYSDFFFFNPVSTAEIEPEIMLLPLNKASGLYSIPTLILKSARHIISKPLADIIHISIVMSKYPSKLNKLRLFLSLNLRTQLTQVIIARSLYYQFLTGFLRN